MTFREKMLQRIQAAEALEEAIGRWEQWAENQVPEQSLTGELRLLEIRKALEGKLAYKNLVSNRNIALEWAKVYALLVLTEPDLPTMERHSRG